MNVDVDSATGGGGEKKKKKNKKKKKTSPKMWKKKGLRGNVLTKGSHQERGGVPFHQKNRTNTKKRRFPGTGTAAHGQLQKKKSSG